MAEFNSGEGENYHAAVKKIVEIFFFFTTAVTTAVSAGTVAVAGGSVLPFLAPALAIALLTVAAAYLADKVWELYLTNLKMI